MAQLVLYGFWIFFAGLIFYLRREDKREGYPLDSESTGVKRQGFPAMPEPKTFELEDGRVVHAPRVEASAPVANAAPTAPWPGSPLAPVGDPMRAGVGPGSFGTRADHPERGPDGAPKIQPLRVATEYSIAKRDPDPRGMPVIGADGEVAGTVVDAWIDREEPQVRYLEVELPGAEGQAGPRVLAPMPLVRVDARRGAVRVNSLRAAQFADIPRLAGTDQITLQEEERVVAYFGAGQLYATPARGEPLL